MSKTKETQQAAASVEVLTKHIQGKFIVEDGELSLPLAVYDDSLALSGLTPEGAAVQHLHDRHYAGAIVRGAGEHAHAMFQADSGLGEVTASARVGEHGAKITTKTIQSKVVRNPGTGAESTVYGSTVVTVDLAAAEIKAARQAVKEAGAALFAKGIDT
jgi:hypothetical protein